MKLRNIGKADVKDGKRMLERVIFSSEDGRFFAKLNGEMHLLKAFARNDGRMKYSFNMFTISNYVIEK